jgi:hypothetical protein
MKFAFYSLLLFVVGCKIEQKTGSPFCKALLENSPTRDDYIRNWQPNGDAASCTTGTLLESCQKKQDDAFREGLLCYKNPLFMLRR